MEFKCYKSKLIPKYTLNNGALAFCRISHRRINYLIGPLTDDVT